MKKAEIIEYWNRIKPNQEIAISEVPYKHEGSTYAEDGIRLTGSQKFIDSILSRIKDLLECEGDNTRLQLVYKQSVDKETGYPLPSYNCYIQVRERGGEAKMMNAFIAGIRQRRT